MFTNKRIKLNETNERTNERLFGCHKKEVRNKSEQNNGANIKCVKSDKNELPIKMFAYICASRFSAGMWNCTIS